MDFKKVTDLHPVVEEFRTWLKITRVPNVIPSRVPQTYHHDLVRRNAWNKGYKEISRSDVARSVQVIQDKFGDDLYYNHLVLGCLYKLMRDDLQSMLKAIWGNKAFNLFVMEIMNKNESLPEELADFEYLGDKSEEN